MARYIDKEYLRAYNTEKKMLTETIIGLRKSLMRSRKSVKKTAGKYSTVFQGRGYKSNIRKTSPSRLKRMSVKSLQHYASELQILRESVTSSVKGAKFMMRLSARLRGVTIKQLREGGDNIFRSPIEQFVTELIGKDEIVEMYRYEAYDKAVVFAKYTEEDVKNNAERLENYFIDYTHSLYNVEIEPYSEVIKTHKWQKKKY